MSFTEVPDYDPPISSRSRNRNTTKTVPTPKDKIKERIKNIYRTDLKNNIWDKKLKSTVSSNIQKSTSTLKTENNKPESAVLSNSWPNVQSPIITKNVSNFSQNTVKTDTQKLAEFYRAKVLNAYNNRRIFIVYGGYYPIRKSLLDRGWLEKLGYGWFPNINYLPDEELLKNSKPGNDYEKLILSRMLYNYPAFFVYQYRFFQDQFFNAMPIRSYINRSANLDFSTKVGITGCTKHWLKLHSLCTMNYPRCYFLNNTEERKEFIDDYRRTQCRNLFRFVIENISTPYNLADIENGTILLAPTLTYAIEYITGQLYNWKYLAWDMENKNEKSKLNYSNWIYFVYCCESIINGRSKFKASVETIQKFATIAKDYLQIIDEIRPAYKWDGVRNIWILKPAYECRGHGIVVKSSLNDILHWAKDRFARNYIVQKYIERPLLIYDTKFDIRLYMIVSIGKTDASIWLYKDCYLKFSSQVFSLDNLSASIHLTNNTVQVHYPIDKNRDRRLPAHNMWSLEQFNNYLQWINAPADIWSKKIFAGIKENLMGVVLASFESTRFVPNTFELYGCDFMLDENYNPILIEINHTPDMAHSTPVTARLCPMVLYDLVKVVIDVSNYPNAPTGLFELVHSVNYKNLNASGKAKTTQPVNTSGKAMAAAQESLNTIGKAITVAQVNTSSNAMPVTQENLNAIGKNIPVPQGNTSGNAISVPQESLNAISKTLTDPQDNTIGNAKTVPQNSLNTSGKAMKNPQINTSANDIKVPQESLNTISKALTDPQVNTSGNAMAALQKGSNTNSEAMKDPQDNTIGNAEIDPQVNTIGNDMTVPQESLNTINKAMTDPQVNTSSNAMTVPEKTISKTLTDPQVNTSGNAMAALQEGLTTKSKAMKDLQDTTVGNAKTVPQKILNTNGDTMTVPEVYTSSNAMTALQDGLYTNSKALKDPQDNTIGNAETDLQVNTSGNDINVPQESLNSNSKAMTDPHVNTSNNAMTVPQESLNTISEALTDPQSNISGNDIKVPQETFNTKSKAMTIPQVNTNSNAMTVHQESLSTIGKALTDPQVNTSGNAMAALQEGLNTTCKAMTDPQVNTSGNAITVPQSNLSNSVKKVKQAPYKVSFKDTKTQQQAAKKVEEKNPKEKYYQKLFAKRLELTKFLRSLKS